MNDQNFHEIQLSGKQLLFGFMSAVVLLVIIFLLGVSVGRGVRSGTPPDARDAVAVPGAPGDTTVPTVPPSGTAPAPGDLNYPAVLKGESAQSTKGTPSTPAPQTMPPQPPAAPPAASQPPTTPPATTATKPVPDSTAAAASEKKPVPPKPPTPAPGGRWWAQVGAFSTQAAADAVAATVTARGFAARVAHAGNRYRVRVGPFASEAEANREVQRLQKAGFQSVVAR